ncbi:unnamed protein product [Heterobilharzia americana]|nr:unnamed protein product [Heterobilharzia americana]CAH8621649.1 unnamed protein product [Heterobilharzia americana]
MSQFQPISLSQSVQMPSQQSVQPQQMLQQNPCQYQLEPCDIKPQFSLIPNVSQNLTNNMNVSQGGIVSGINNVTTGQFATAMSHADVASLLMNPSKRAETFVIDEVRVMLKEIEARKHILLSLSPSTNRLKRRAWEEVAVCMANRWPHAPRRTADQVKKKWENLVSKTKRKVRAGHVTPELDWNETNAAVMQFLTQHSPPIRLRYSTSTTPSLLGLGDIQSSSASTASTAISSISCSNSFNPSNSNIYGLPNNSFLDPYNNNNAHSLIFSNNQQSSLSLSTAKSPFLNSSLHQENKVSNNNNKNSNAQQSFGNHESNDLNSFGVDKQHLNSSTEENDVDMTTGNNQTGAGDTTDEVGNITGSVHESFLSSFSPFNQSLINFGLPSNTESLYTTFSRDIQKELYSQLKQEHEIRMDILRLQKQTWLLQMNLFKKMKVEQISSLFSSPCLANTSNTNSSNTTTSNSNSISGSNNNNSDTNTTTIVPASTTMTATAATATTNTPVSASLSTTMSGVNGTICTVISTPATTAITSSTSTSTLLSTANASSLLNVKIESESITPNHSLSPMFPHDGHTHRSDLLTNSNNNNCGRLNIGK